MKRNGICDLMSKVHFSLLFLSLSAHLIGLVNSITDLVDTLSINQDIPGSIPDLKFRKSLKID